MEDEEEEAGGGGWLVSFADLMTLLFAAFVVLYGITPQGESQMRGVESPVKKRIVDQASKLNTNRDEGGDMDGRFFYKSFYGQTWRQFAEMITSVKSDPQVRIDHDKNLVENLLDQIATDPDGVDYNLRNAMNAEADAAGITIRIIGAVFFQPGSWRFSREGRKRFLRMGELLRKIGKPVLIEGHTDSRRASGLSNSSLGAMRAGNAARLLVTELDMNPQKIDTMSYGATRPLESNETSKGRRKNRRIEIKIPYR